MLLCSVQRDEVQSASELPASAQVMLRAREEQGTTKGKKPGKPISYFKMHFDTQQDLKLLTVLMNI